MLRVWKEKYFTFCIFYKSSKRGQPYRAIITNKNVHLLSNQNILEDLKDEMEALKSSHGPNISSGFCLSTRCVIQNRLGCTCPFWSGDTWSLASKTPCSVMSVMKVSTFHFIWLARMGVSEFSNCRYKCKPVASEWRFISQTRRCS